MQVPETAFRRRAAHWLRRFPWLTWMGVGLLRLTRYRFTAGVVGVVVDAAGRVLLVEHVFHPQYPWGLPGGWMERREDPVTCLKREMEEELGLAVEVSQILAIETGKVRGHLDIAFLCHPLGEVQRLSLELLDYRWADPGDSHDLSDFHLKVIDRALRHIEITSEYQGKSYGDEFESDETRG